eukprot:GILJ01001760.1.p1 GENE.GILJ01001760.1~~GILJ01001760.1.p1  ORF type:complete len:257 (+),score=14.68 GILJ01001760.1:100-870(+)
MVILTWYQVGGHSHHFLLDDDGRRILKIAHHPREPAFYRALATSEDTFLKSVVPTYFGAVDVNQPHGVQEYMALENVLAACTHPCVMDIKMGARTYGEDATEAKIAEQVAKQNASTTAKLGFRVVGFCSRSSTGTVLVQGSKRQCKSITVDAVPAVLREFFTQEKKLRTEVVRHVISRLEKIKEWFSRQSSYRFYATSLLFVYDAIEGGHMDVRMIDFAHVHEIKDGGRDEGYIQALDSLLRFLYDILSSKIQAQQ